MKVHVYSRGSTIIDMDPQYQEPGVAAALRPAGNGEAADDESVVEAITCCTDSEVSDISYDHYAVVTEDDGTELWRGWLSGDFSAPPPPEAQEAGR